MFSHDYIQFDPSQKGLQKFIDEAEEQVLRCLWERKGKEYSVSQVHSYVSENSLQPIALSDIMGFLDVMEKEGVVKSRKIGNEALRMYSAKMNEDEFRKYLIKKVVESILSDFPEASMKTLKDLGISKE